MGKLSGKVALVTGGAGGIGGAIARVLAAEGADIGIVDKNAEGARSTADVIQRLAVRSASAEADVSDEAQSKAAFAAVTKTLGDIDILCNNAGIGTSSPFSDMSLDMWDEMIRVNLRSIFLCTRLVLPAMRRKKWGRIINTASQLGHKGAPHLVHYCAAKAGVMDLPVRLPMRWHVMALQLMRSRPARSRRRCSLASRRNGRMQNEPSCPSGGSAASTKLLTPWPCSRRMPARITSA